MLGLQVGSVFDRVRAGSAAVAERARHLRIDRARIPEYARSLPLDQARAPELDPKSHYLGHGEDTAAFVVTLDAINFGSGYFPHLRKRPGMSGYFTVASSLADRFREKGPIPASALSALTTADCAAIFGQDLANEAARELMDLFARALNDLGRYLLERFGGTFVRLIEAADHSAERLLNLLAAMPFFRDVERYEGLEVPFYKRAQLTAADLALAFGGEGLGRCDDLDRLTIFADNLVPHVLRVDGVLRYADELARRIDAEELIPAGSPEEVEIRACAVHAVELIAKELQAAGRDLTAMQLDYLLWNRGQEPVYKQACPRHRTRTVFY
jgi:hypothetical protein